jgi:hypothetical protein
MILRILSHTPAYVFVVLGLLIVLGLLQTRRRDVSRMRVLVLPAALLVLSLSATVSAFAQPVLALAAWSAGFGVAMTLGGRSVAVRQAVWLPATRRFRVPGSWLPLVLIVSLFLLKYTAAVVLALYPSLTSTLGAVLSLSALYGAFAGLFWGRARSLIALIGAGGERGQQAA